MCFLQSTISVSSEMNSSSTGSISIAYFSFSWKFWERLKTVFEGYVLSYFNLPAECNQTHYLVKLSQFLSSFISFIINVSARKWYDMMWRSSPACYHITKRKSRSTLSFFLCVPLTTLKLKWLIKVVAFRYLQTFVQKAFDSAASTTL